MTIRVVELFAGVGGFRLGLEGQPGSPRNRDYKVVYSNQWEPQILTQHAADVYCKRWGLEQVEDDPTLFTHPNHPDDTFRNEDLADVALSEIPDHDVLVGGFPCQDYSVAQGHRGRGIKGKKGVLWWEIVRIVKDKKPNHLLLENVNRLISSPAKQRGRDMAIMLSVLDQEGYAVEWRVIDASDYGFPQKRKRVFILAHKKGTKLHKSISKRNFDGAQWITKNGPFAKAFPVAITKKDSLTPFVLNKYKGRKNLQSLTTYFNRGKGDESNLPSPFLTSGVMIGNKYWTTKVQPEITTQEATLGDILLPPSKIACEFIIDQTDVDKERGWNYFKGAKKAVRTAPNGHQYSYNEGGMYFPDRIDKASRTIVTGEGGSSPSRNKHVVQFKPTKSQIVECSLDSKRHEHLRSLIDLRPGMWIRRLTPIELELLNGFPADHTFEGLNGPIIASKRAFFMGNALVVGVVHRIGQALLEWI
jgi:DNA (cytosine-5)-methyltransferase 1